MNVRPTFGPTDPRTAKTTTSRFMAICGGSRPLSSWVHSNGPEQLSAIQDWLANDFAEARVIEARHARLPLELVLGQMHPNTNQSSPAELHHGKLFKSISFSFGQAIDPEFLGQALLRNELGILRAKGFAKAMDGTDREIQIVGQRLTTSTIPAIPYAGIVCIGAANQLRSDLIGDLIAQACQSSADD